MSAQFRGASRVATLGGLRAHYVEWGDPAAPPVLLLHGLRSYARTWDVLAQDLARDHRVLALDFRGRGASGWDPERRYFTPHYVTDVEEWAERLGIGRFSLVGHSMGGTVGYVYAARHPDQVHRLVVEDIGPGSSTGGPGLERIRRELTSTPDSFPDAAAVERFWRRLRPGISEQALASRLRHTVREEPDGSWAWRHDMHGIAHARLSGDPAGGIDLWACVEQLRCPTLVLRGESSDFLPEATCREMAARQPLLRWDTIAGAGHYTHDDNPADFGVAVRAFLRETG